METSDVRKRILDSLDARARRDAAERRARNAEVGAAYEQLPRNRRRRRCVHQVATS